MKSHELLKIFNDSYALSKLWPKSFEVDAETYANCCNAVFDWTSKSTTAVQISQNQYIRVCIGPNKGLMFKNVELILKG